MPVAKDALAGMGWDGLKRMDWDSEGMRKGAMEDEMEKTLVDEGLREMQSRGESPLFLQTRVLI